MTTATNSWATRLAPYRCPDDRRAVFEIIVTVIPFMALWGVAWAALQVSFALALPAAIGAAGFMVRLFILQHDCGHGSMFSSRTVNDWVGRVLGLATMTPYDDWRYSHARHHASSGNLDRRGFGDISTLTVKEYNALDNAGRLKYRIYRHPLIMFVIGPTYQFLLRHRLPIYPSFQAGAPWFKVLATNAGTASICGVLIYFVGLTDFLLIQLPIVAIAASIGVWLFYVQHQFDYTHWEHNDNWTHEEASLHGSSFYDLPRPLMWLTGNIGIHHIHHLSSQIPFHRLPKILNDYPELKEIGRLRFWESLKCIRLALWDENTRRLISFRQLGSNPSLPLKPAA